MHRSSGTPISIAASLLGALMVVTALHGLWVAFDNTAGEAAIGGLLLMVFSLPALALGSLFIVFAVARYSGASWAAGRGGCAHIAVALVGIYLEAVLLSPYLGR